MKCDRQVLWFSSRWGMGDNGTHGSLFQSVGEEADKIGALFDMFLAG